ncbi:LuxR C-terminal-related transcriptional regulator [Geodermatophilus sp. YIM 151500]|uniref:HD domain-containing phosphohydrolase n=1 Tax=Geodermatophilus sp. YIM 151500 TaxID=2984531 RepID=UPI0021E4D2F3|nr:HD domain-containing phosphohydrolase [Geodermatophilus sp. YIM 151500]MCV2491327.1 LuxR C-terminal-related transcriptional regulator [Geodermatophilus sp. YIM 151500]
MARAGGAGPTPARSPVRLAELVVGLSGVADLGMGLPVGSAARVADVGVQLAGRLGCGRDDVAAVFWAALLQHIGCTGYSHEVSALFADETAVKRASLATDFTRPREFLLGYLPRIAAGAPPGDRLRSLRSALLHGRQMTRGYRAANCETAAGVAARLGLPAATRQGLLHMFEWWNGGGGPNGLRGGQISIVARVVNTAGYAVFFDRIGGPPAARTALARRSGGYLDPAAVAVLLAHAHELLTPQAAGDASDRLLAAEPTPCRLVPDGPALDEVLRVFGEAADLKSPFLHGHCTSVARLAEGACRRLGLPERAVVLARRAGLVQDVGRVAVPSSVWEHAGPLGSDAWQQVRLHAYQSEQVLSRSRHLADVARLAGSHHERLDGSGYHRGAAAAELPTAARVLAAADRYAALVAERPHRPPASAARAASELRADVRAGQLDPDAVQAVVAIAEGRRADRSARLPAGLTARQLEVLLLLVRGTSNREIARRLTISTRTAEHHVQDVYGRIGVSSRAAAALFAMEHGLVQPAWMSSPADDRAPARPSRSLPTAGHRPHDPTRRAP